MVINFSPYVENGWVHYKYIWKEKMYGSLFKYNLLLFYINISANDLLLQNSPSSLCMIIH